MRFIHQMNLKPIKVMNARPSFTDKLRVYLKFTGMFLWKGQGHISICFLLTKILDKWIPQTCIYLAWKIEGQQPKGKKKIVCKDSVCLHAFFFIFFKSAKISFRVFPFYQWNKKLTKKSFKCCTMFPILGVIIIKCFYIG